MTDSLMPTVLTKVAFRPNTVCAPIDLAEEWKFGLHTFGRVSLDQPYYFTNLPLGWNRDQQVDVIFVSVDCFELEVRMMLVNGLDSSQNEGLDTRDENLAPVFCRKHDVIVTEKKHSETYDGRRLASSLMIVECDTQDQADAGKAMQPRPYGRGIVGLE